MRRMNPLHIVQLAMAVSGISTLLMPLAPSYGWLVLYSIMYGLADGGMGCATFVIPAKMLSEEERAMGFAILQVVTCITYAGGSPLAGKLFKHCTLGRSQSIVFMDGGGGGGGGRLGREQESCSRPSRTGARRNPRQTGERVVL